jgi:ribosomal subunit interface protein
VDIVITGRRTEVPDRFRRLAEEKLLKISQFAPRAHRVDVELSHERNPRQADHCEKVEITVRDKGPVIRAEASAEDQLAALDLAFGKLLERLRRLGDRRKVHHGRHTPTPVRDSDVLAPPAPVLAEDNGAAVPGQQVPVQPGGGRSGNGVVEVPGTPRVGLAVAERSALPTGTRELPDSPVVIRTKDHHAVPMTVEQALYEMELVGHDFFLFVDVTCDRASVVYRRRGWEYGVIRLQPDDAQDDVGS